jgi:hypothetical protein
VKIFFSFFWYRWEAFFDASKIVSQKITTVPTNVNYYNSWSITLKILHSSMGKGSKLRLNGAWSRDHKVTLRVKWAETIRSGFIFGSIWSCFHFVVFDLMRSVFLRFNIKLCVFVFACNNSQGLGAEQGLANLNFFWIGSGSDRLIFEKLNRVGIGSDDPQKNWIGKLIQFRSNCTTPGSEVYFRIKTHVLFIRIQFIKER